MKVLLLSHTPDPVKTCALAAKLCYSSSKVEELASKLENQEQKNKDLLQKVIKMGHHSILEHASFTFGVSGISRVATHQLVRHRIASFSQQSQRYVGMSGHSGFYIPESINQDKNLREKFIQFMESALDFYTQMLQQDIKKEDARYVLPHAFLSNIVITMNARSLFNFFKLRLCKRAQYEIRILARQMYKILYDEFEEIFKYAGPSCLTDKKCQEGEFSCKEPYTSVTQVLNERNQDISPKRRLNRDIYLIQK